MRLTTNNIRLFLQKSRRAHRTAATAAAVLLMLICGCERRPELHLLKIIPTTITITSLQLQLDVAWDYSLIYGVDYECDTVWDYGWDDEDVRIFGPMGYEEPDIFNFRRYYTGSTPYAPHTNVIRNTIEGREFTGYFDLGYWDLLVWNDIRTIDGVQSLIFDESSLDSVTATTNQSMRVARYQAPRFTHAFNQPEPIYTAYEEAIEINDDLSQYEYDTPVRDKKVV